jgi:transposase
MVNRKISADIKQCAVTLWNCGWQLGVIGNILGISQRSIYRWQENLGQHGSVLPPPSPLRGRPRLIARATLDVVQTLLEKDPDLFVDELLLCLALHHDIAVSPSTLHRNLREAGLTHKRIQKIASERNEQQWQDWKSLLREEFRGDGREFVCLDETSKDERSYARRYGWASSGKRPQLRDVFVRGDRYSLLAAMTVEGYIAACVIPGSFDSIEFYDFVCEEVVS